MITHFPKIFASLLLFLSIYPVTSESAPALFEQEVKESKKVKFQNKNNLKATEDKLARDAKTGEALADLSQKQSKDQISGILVTRTFSKSKKLGADVITLTDKFKAGHIHTIKRIMTSYIQKAYEYDEKNSELLAYYVLYYNVMHRKNIKFFKKKYETELVNTLNPKIVGISKKFNEWSGNTQIVVPLSKNILKDKNTDLTISELQSVVNKDLDKKKRGEEVKNELSNLVKDKLKEEKKLIENKKTDVKEKEESLAKIESEKLEKINELKKDPKVNPEELKKLEKEKEDLQKEKEKLLESKKAIEEKEKELAKTEKKIEKTERAKEESKGKQEEPKKSAENPSPEKEVSETKAETPDEKGEEKPAGDEKNKVVQNNPETETKPEKPAEVKVDGSPGKTPPQNPAKENVEKEGTKEQVQQAKVDPKAIEKELQDKSKDLQDKTKELQELKKTIEEKATKSENLLGDKILFLQVVKYENDGHFTNDLWLLDPEEEEGLYKSPFENICGRDFKILKSGILVIGFEGLESDSTLHHLVLLDKDTLALTKISKENIFWRSQLFLMDGKIYAFEISEEKKIYLSRFSDELVLEARSSEPVNINSDITFNKNKIFVTSKVQGSNATSITVLNKEDLKVTKNFKPTQKRPPKK